MTLNRTSNWLVTEPKKAFHIPTLGYPASAIDLFRTVGCSVTGHEGWNSCFADVQTCKGLAKLIEGEITSWDEVEAAELALQILMWHDRLDVMIPSYQMVSGSFSFYKRSEEDRSKLCFDLFGELEPYDVMYAVERVEVEDNIIIGSTMPNSPMLGIDHRSVYDYLSKSLLQSQALSSIPVDFGVPAYFSNPALQHANSKGGWFGRLYQSLETGWRDSINIEPNLSYDIHVPPLMSIVLHRASNRDQIPDVIKELRYEMQKVRFEIVDFSNHLEDFKKGGVRQDEIYKKCKYIQDSFSNIVKATACDDYLVSNLVRVFTSCLSPLDLVINSLMPDGFDLSAKILADRTVAGQKLSQMLKVDYVFKLLKKHFSATEIFNITKSYQGKRI